MNFRKNKRVTPSENPSRVSKLNSYFSLCEIHCRSKSDFLIFREMLGLQFYAKTDCKLLLNQDMEIEWP